MKGTVFSVALNHRSQLDAWDQAFHQPPYQTPPKTPVWFIKPRNTHLANGGAIPFPAGETVQSGGTLAVIIGDTVRKVPAAGEPEDIAAAMVFLASPAAAYITGQTLVVDGGALLPETNSLLT